MKKILILLLLFIFGTIGYSQHTINNTHINKKYDYIIRIPEHSINLDSIYIDTIFFKRALKVYNLYDDFNAERWNRIDINKFKKCLIDSRVHPMITDSIEINPNEVYTKSIESKSKISSGIKNVMKSTAEIHETHAEPPPPPPPPPVVTETNKILSDPEAPITIILHKVKIKTKNIESINKAELTYVIKDTMMVGKPYTVDLTLSRDISQINLVKIIDGFKNKELIDTLINITPIMRARLIDPSGKNFTVTPITDEIQNTTNSNLIRWQWQIIPLVEGNNYLSISVDNYINGKPQSVNIFNGKTYVYAIHTWYGDLWNLIKINWTYITYIIGGIFAIFAWLYKEKIISIFKRKT